MRPTRPSVDLAAWVNAIKHVSDLAHLKLPAQLHGRVERGTALVLNGMVQPAEDGHGYQVLNSKATEWYAVNGTCPCEDHARAPEGLCKHRLGVMIHRRASELLSQETQGETSAPSAPGEKAAGSIPAQFIKQLHGKHFVLYAGLLAMAHERGLTSLAAKFITVTPELALAEATATFADGRSFTEAADATPQNVTAQVRPHYARMALVRAKARALRDALNIGMCTLEELGEEIEGGR